MDLEEEAPANHGIDTFLRLQKDPMVDPCDDELSDEQLRESVSSLKVHWTSKLPESDSVAEEAARRFGVLDLQKANTLLPTGQSGLETVLMRIEFAITRLQTQLERRGHFDNSLSDTSAVVDPGSDLTNDVLRIRECIVRLHRVLETELFAKKACDPSWGSEMPSYRNPFGISMFEAKKMNDQQQFLVQILKCIAAKGYMRQADGCQEEIFSAPVGPTLKRQRTHAFRRVCDIKAFVQSVAPKETMFEMWRNMTSGHNIESAVKYLSNSKEVEFQDLHPDRHWFAFENGLQYTLGKSSKYFFAYGDKEIPADVVAVKFHEGHRFDESILNEEDWQNIPTPTFQKVIEDQMTNLNVEERHEVMRSIQMLLGRFFFEVNELDGWQVIPFFVGRAGTGKSMILDQMKEFFPDDDVATIANNSQKGFGLETVQDKMAWRIMEVKNDLTLDQAQMQSMITGEEVSIQRKGLKAVSIVWKAPGLLAGNELAKWSDNSGSISRRLVIVRFDNKVKNSNPNMKNELRNERPKMLHKCVQAYLEAIDRFGKKDIWGRYYITDPSTNIKYECLCLPQQFHDQRKRVQEETHAVASFLHSEQITLTTNKNIGMPMEEFRKRAKEYFISKNLDKFTWNEEKYLAVFADNDIDLVKLTAIDIERNGGPQEFEGTSYGVGKQWLKGVTLSSVFKEIEEKIEAAKKEAKQAGTRVDDAL